VSHHAAESPAGAMSSTPALQQAFGKYLVVDGEYIWKYTHKAYDFSVLGNTPITYPDRVDQFEDSRLCHPRQHAELPRAFGVRRDVQRGGALLHPQVSGIGARRAAASVFRIDHDELFNQTTHLQYQPFKNLPWIGFNWRYDSGLVAGPVPCAGGNCANGPNGDRFHCRRLRHHAGSAVPGRTLLRQRARDAHHSDQPTASARRRMYGSTYSRFPPPEPRTTTTIRRASRRAISSTSAWEMTICFTATSTSGARAFGGQHRIKNTTSSRSAMYNFLLDVQRHALRDAAVRSRQTIGLSTSTSLPGKILRISQPSSSAWEISVALPQPGE
jgi:hypothetical protein